MLSSLVATAFMVGAIAMIFWTPAVFAKGIWVISYGTLSTREKVLTKIPIVNIIMSEKAYTGRVSSVGISVVVMILSLIARLIVVFYAPSMTILNIVTIIVLLLSFVAYMLTNMILIWIVLTDTDATSLGTKIGLSIVFPLGQYYVGNFLPTVMKNLAKEEETFK